MQQLAARRSSHLTSPFLLEPAVIPSLGPELETVPYEREAWEEWRYRVIAFRELRRRECIGNKAEQNLEMALCAADPAYWLTMYGIILEPRDLEDRPPEWLRWIPFAFQVQFLRWIQHTMKQSKKGRGDGIVEKSRGMGATWIFCAYTVWAWLFLPVFTCGVISRTGDAVDKTGSADTLFYKIRSLMGVEPQLPEKYRLPKWMIPKGMSEDHIVKMSITHPTKTCIITGETTTALSGVSGRNTMRWTDEAARFAEFPDSWRNQNSVTQHRFALSSADMAAPLFKVLADRGKEAWNNPEMAAPECLRLDWWIHPFQDQEWYIDTKDRFSDDPAYFSREYEIDYRAGEGDRVYRKFEDYDLVDAPFEHHLGKLYCAIDPGVSDPTAIVWLQEDQITRRFRVVEAFEGLGGEEAEFFASVLCGIKISGAHGYDYSRYPRIDELMEWLANLNRPITYFGDPYGNHRGADGKRTFYEALRDKAHELSDGRNRVHVNSITKWRGKDARGFVARKEALLELAGRLDFNRSAGGSLVLTALKESRYPERKPGRVYQTEILEPQHDEFSHIRSAVEFWAVNLTAAGSAGRTSSVAEPVRRNMSGKVQR